MADTNLLALEKAIDPARYSVQSRATDAPFAPSSDVAGSGGVFWLTMAAQQNDEAPGWNATYPNYRDRYLLNFSRSEPMLASAVYSMGTRIATLNYEINGPPRAKKFASELLDNPGLGDTLSTLTQKLSHDLDVSDNGAFMELWRPGNPLTDAGNRPVLGFAHLDSRQCWRSYDPEFPVWYTNPITGEIRKIHQSRVVFTADNPQPVELARGIGYCATSRVMRMARVFKNMQIFLDEKVGGRFTRALGAVSGVTSKQLRGALEQSEDNADSKGFVVYKEIPFLINPNLEAGSEIKIIMQDLASIPDGFVFRDDADLYAYILAFAFGVDAREFWPATQSGATKADASVQNMKARGRGIGNRIETIEFMLRQALPDSVTFEYDYSDDEQDKQAAEIHKLETDTLKTFFDMGMEYYKIEALAVAKGILDADVLNTLQQPLTSDDNSAQPDQAPDTTTTDTGAPAEPQAEDASMKSYSSYRQSLRGLTANYWGGNASAYDFTDDMSHIITLNFTDAWEEVERLYGINPDERTEASQQRLTLAINTEITYISGFANAIEAGSKANGGALQPLLDRADLWAKGYSRMVTLAQLVVGSDIKLKWKLGATEQHCADCLQYSDKIYYRSQWEEAGAAPQSHDLECGGWNCDCSFEPTTERKTYGAVPPLIGHKHLHTELPTAMRDRSPLTLVFEQALPQPIQESAL